MLLQYKISLLHTTDHLLGVVASAICYSSTTHKEVKITQTVTYVCLSWASSSALMLCEYLGFFLHWNRPPSEHWKFGLKSVLLRRSLIHEPIRQLTFHSKTTWAEFLSCGVLLDVLCTSDTSCFLHTSCYHFTSMHELFKGTLIWLKRFFRNVIRDKHRCWKYKYCGVFRECVNYWSAKPRNKRRTSV
jgi:hypothetical protein